MRGRWRWPEAPRGTAVAVEEGQGDVCSQPLWPEKVVRPLQTPPVLFCLQLFLLLCLFPFPESEGEEEGVLRPLPDGLADVRLGVTSCWQGASEFEDS